MNPKKQERRNCAVNNRGEVPVLGLFEYHPTKSTDSDSSPVQMVKNNVGRNMNRLL